MKVGELLKALNARNLTVFLGILTTIGIVVYYLFRNKTYYDFLLWNLFLAWIPYVISLAASRIHSQKATKLTSLFIVLLGGLWILFLPNAPYIITDLIHLTVRKSIYIQNGRLSFAYWYDFFIMVLFSWIGIFLGCSSMYFFQRVCMVRFNRFLSWVMIAIASLLTGYGILLGREYRLNSWDALLNNRLLQVIDKTMNKESLIFCLLVGLVMLMFYTTLYLLANGSYNQSLKKQSDAN
ncbi:DUF1361 domain-containing protein [Paenibacillus sp. SYP-B3998]|uniref:DUF1361 domain-containing protein n=1 Tax=Paenibacillus sp. SYP-B3998 TaxID=2678564 RepID=A0A6G3ZW06_9BACL|nr:DUF1361 domain-containing protein [Paenibacillus sp. SYP-B3998]NEW06295.1 DUF1361 domain-containing protein [Paenibacillus sp. SYP-B3998]